MLDTSLPVRSVWLRYNHKKLLITICHSNYPPFVIPLILLVIPTQEESIIILCYSLILLVITTQEESIALCVCHSDAGGIYTPTAIYHTLFFPIRKENLFFLGSGPSSV